jgi:hypothetical protein
VRKSQHFLELQLDTVASFTDTGHGTDILHKERSELRELGDGDDGTPGSGGRRSLPALDVQSAVLGSFESGVSALLGSEREEVVLLGLVAERWSLRAALVGANSVEVLEGGKHVAARNVGASVSTKEQLVLVVVMFGVGVEELRVEPLDGVFEPVDRVFVAISEDDILGASGDAGLVGPPLDDSSGDPVLELARAGFAGVGKESHATYESREVEKRLETVVSTVLTRNAGQEKDT